ncbi:YhbY family RNA-binding protein [Christensenellaceae bacterium OttesenSCG-928-L17]|nr:YhbY family RNA-binding protein [Christensenellaceae bacterium OttesenSCG-928-L17]
MELNSRQRAQLRKMANGIPAIFQIGKAGITEELISQLSLALEARELIKITVLETAPQSARETADALSLPLRAEVVQSIGRKAVLYRQSHTNKQIELCK